MYRHLFGETRFETSNPLHDAKQAIHVTLTAIMFWLGGILVLPGSTFATSHSYVAMEKVANEETWAAAFLGIAILGAAGLIVTGPIRKLSVIGLATMHGTLAICLFMGNPSGTGPGTYAIIALLGYYLLYRRMFRI